MVIIIYDFVNSYFFSCSNLDLLRFVVSQKQTTRILNRNLTQNSHIQYDDSYVMCMCLFVCLSVCLLDTGAFSLTCCFIACRTL